MLKPEYLLIFKSIPLQLMFWLLVSPGHQQPQTDEEQFNTWTLPYLQFVEFFSQCMHRRPLFLELSCQLANLRCQFLLHALQFIIFLKNSTLVFHWKCENQIKALVPDKFHHGVSIPNHSSDDNFKISIINSLAPSDMVSQIWANTDSGKGLLPDGTKPLPEPMLAYHPWHLVPFSLGQFPRKSILTILDMCLEITNLLLHLSRVNQLKCVWKLHAKNSSESLGDLRIDHNAHTYFLLVPGYGKVADFSFLLLCTHPGNELRHCGLVIVMTYESWPHIFESTLAQVMASCLTAPSHYLNQFWLVISDVLWQWQEINFTVSAHATILCMSW